MNRTAKVDAANQFLNLLSGVPLVESPFFNEVLAELELDEPTKAAAVQLHTQGWAVIDFPDPEIDVIAERIKKSLHSHYDWDYWRAKGWQDNHGLRVQDTDKFNADVRRMVPSQFVLELV
jgi:hypothetical protein